MRVQTGIRTGSHKYKPELERGHASTKRIYDGVTRVPNGFRTRSREEKQEVGRDMWHVNMTCDMLWGSTQNTWNLTCDTWNMTCDTWQVTCDMLWGVNILSKFQPNEWMNEWLSDKDVCRTAPATLGLLIIESLSSLSNGRRDKHKDMTKFKSTKYWQQQMIQSEQFKIVSF